MTQTAYSEHAQKLMTLARRVLIGWVQSGAGVC